MKLYEIIKYIDDNANEEISYSGKFTIINKLEDLWNCTKNGKARIFVVNNKAEINEGLIDVSSKKIKGLKIIKSDIASCDNNVAGILYEDSIIDICDTMNECNLNMKSMFGDLFIDSAANVYFEKNVIQLSITEYKLLYFLVNQPDKTATYKEIMKAIWQNDDEDIKIITDLVRRLRIKLEQSGSKVCVVSLKKSGYYLEYMN